MTLGILFWGEGCLPAWPLAACLWSAVCCCPCWPSLSSPPPSAGRPTPGTTHSHTMHSYLLTYLLLKGKNIQFCLLSCFYMIRFNRSRAGHPRHHLRINASPSQWRRIWIFLNDSVFGDVSKICREFPIFNKWYKSSLLGPHPQTYTHQPPPPCHTHNLKSLVSRLPSLSLSSPISRL